MQSNDLADGWIRLTRGSRYCPPPVIVDANKETEELVDSRIRRALRELHLRRTKEWIERNGIDAYEQMFGPLRTLKVVSHVTD